MLNTTRPKQCRINNGANGAAAPGPPQLGAPHQGFFFCTRSKFYIHYCQNAFSSGPRWWAYSAPQTPSCIARCPRQRWSGTQGLPFSERKAPPLKFCTRPPTLVIRHWSQTTNTYQRLINYNPINYCRLHVEDAVA